MLCGGALYAADARYREALGPGLIEPAYEIGGGHNVVNVTLVDARVWDTMGEISVFARGRHRRRLADLRDPARAAHRPRARPRRLAHLDLAPSRGPGPAAERARLRCAPR
ncbi:hydrogen gas-evolving membrane-bound hydrogenase subunit E [Brachybacterium sp. GPGPB12]|uniref:hydrogen gas-evolving membrane-bound hydrogenase subunit E n=1 Tax=Brachybacterium sp. GPGPB12 TaxID=3023517 RepID=UPI0031345E2C